MSTDARLDAARALLAGVGFADAAVLAAGHERDVAVIAGVPAARLADVAALAPRLKQLGFRYVTLDVTELAP